MLCGLESGLPPGPPESWSREQISSAPVFGTVRALGLARDPRDCRAHEKRLHEVTTGSFHGARDAPEDFRDSGGFHTFGVLPSGVLEIISAIGFRFFCTFLYFEN